uniref:ADAM metallopeptidase with thrombospondin type 1 motif 7 n=1 Tax=Sphaeramia orbicularis TaxID=375764 RepID=A0A673B4I8_9TELE
FHRLMSECRPLHYLIALFFPSCNNPSSLPTMAPAEGFPPGLPEYEVVHPTRVDAKGHFLSHFLAHHAQRVQRRDTSEAPADLDRLFYHLWHRGHSLYFKLTLNPHLLAPGFLIERRHRGLRGAQVQPPASTHCYFLGEVLEDASVKGQAALSTCDGLTGFFKFSDEELFIQPLEKSDDMTSVPQAHAIYKRHTSPPSWTPVVHPASGTQPLNSTCGVKSKGHGSPAERQRERWEYRQQRRRRRIHQRSVSKDKWVETLVVADPKMVEYHGSKAVEPYVLAVMNIVSSLFSDPSIGNSINIVVVRLILLEQDEDDLKITHHADNSLNSFCKWQKQLNMKGDDDPLHHDVAVLLTRKDICAAINMPCETLGLSHVAGMCQPHRSCSISEDTGLPLAFTVAHELGHNFGIQHDGNGNDCEPIGKRPFVMSPQLLYGTSLPRWSRCSRQYITRFLDRGWGWCLDDVPAQDKLSVHSVLPGVLYSASHQCRLQYGSGSVLCEDMDDICSTLWCTVGTTCHSKLDGAVDGTSCGEGKWCLSGECVAVGSSPGSVDGGWASWSQWSPCSRTCGSGVQSAHRDCDNPVPKYRGKYCLGERRRYRLCNTTPCLHEQPSFRDLQCSHFNSMPYKGQIYSWVAVINKVSPCELHCRPLDEHFSEKMRDAVTDGTPCYEGSKSRDMCINGICKNVGCDFMISSNAVEDRCGVCNGNGSTCTTVKRTFEESEGLGYVDIGLIPEGAWDIRIEEVAEAGNFLALRSDNPNKYFLNGGWTIQWNGEYKAAGATFTYERTGHLENLTSPGPTIEPLWIQLLFQETNPGVRYEYTINQNVSEDKDKPVSVFFWKYGSWTECSTSCGTGVQRQIVHCVEKTTGIVEEYFCDPLTRPEDNQTRCNKDPCPPIWWVGEWQKCSSSCGSSGLAKRTVLCIQALGVDEQKALEPSECEHMPKPEAVTSCNTHMPCPADWTTSNWSKCSVTCGSGVRRRNISCSGNTGVDCDHQKKPTAVVTCSTQDCPQEVDNFGTTDWSGSGWSSKEVFNEISSIPEANPPPKYTTRSQPQGHQDRNNIVEGDFHYHNNIENTDHSPETTVKIDDFYYDYNFINFHEDLSDDSTDEQELDWPPQEPKSIHSMKENAHVEMTIAPTSASALSATAKATTVYTVKTEETHNTHLDKGEAARKKSMQEKSEHLDDLFAEDYLLPVSSTYSPPPSIVPHSQRQKARHKNLSWPENLKKMPRPTSATRQPKQDVEWEQYGEEADTNSWDLSPTSAPLETSTPVQIPYVLISGNHEVSEDNVSLTGTGLVPPTNMESGAQPSPTSFQAATTHQTATKPAFSETPAKDFTSQTLLDDLADFEYNDVIESSVVTTGGKKYPGLLTTPQPFQTPPQLVKLPIPATSILPTSPPQSPVQTVASINTYWVTGNWSTCSTSCGLGAIWRTLACSTGSESDCDPAKRPAPAQRCYLRPCSTWRVGEWNKCSKNCEGGVKSREVQCFDMRDERPLRPFHCRAMSPCLDWYSSSWGQCSEVCGGGEQQRIVTCPEEDRCDRDLQPSNIQPCNKQPCAQWLTGLWGQCSASCGGGVQRRLIMCINTKAETENELDQDHCNHEQEPESTRKCNVQECESAPSGAVCIRDRLTFRFCQTLSWLGHCHLAKVRAQCCKTCSLRPRSGRTSQR